MSEVVRSIAALRELLLPIRHRGESIGLVPTMGALHRGHRRLLECAREENGIVVASIFVNPLQFDRPEDLESYPRTFETDLALCSETGVHFVFAPATAEMYPQAQLAWVDVPALGEYLCGQRRPGHFRGVSTVVMKLLQIVEPRRAYFGQKDAQQLVVIQRMVHDLNVPVTIVPVATVREDDGLALSSRNKHLNRQERQVATVLPRALNLAKELVDQGERRVDAIQAAARAVFERHPEVRLEYLSIADPETLVPVESIDRPVLIAAAVWVGSTRLIDNVTVSP